MSGTAYGVRKVSLRHKDGTPVFNDEGVLVAQSRSPKLDFRAGLAGNQNPWNGISSQAIQSWKRRFKGIGVTVQQRSIEIRENERTARHLGSDTAAT
jgi:hypothetical protein